jgi:hypothetical protein
MRGNASTQNETDPDRNGTTSPIQIDEQQKPEMLGAYARLE